MTPAARTTDSTRRSNGKVLSVFSRDRALIATCILLVTALAWLYLLHLDQQVAAGVDYERAMAAMGMSVNKPWTFTDALLTFAMWAVMMAGMMAPSAAPVFLLFASMRTGTSKVSGATAMFALGYAAVWTSFSAVATGLQWTLHEAALLSASMATSNRYLSSTILIAAGAYQLTPWKAACLSHCRSPLGFLMSHWRAGKLGAFRMGWRHGLFCLGCCWALMGVLFAVGVMNLVWVAALTIFILLEKTGPWGALAARVGAVALVLSGAAYAIVGG